MLGLHSPSSCSVNSLQADVRFQFFFLLEIHILYAFTLQTGSSFHSPDSQLVWFTLSNQVLGFMFYCFTLQTLQAVVWFTLSKQMLGFKILEFLWDFFLYANTLQTGLSFHSPSSYLVYIIEVDASFQNC